MKLRTINPDSIAPPFARYSHAVGFEPSVQFVVLTSGQLGIDASGNIPDDEGAQADICFANIAAMLEAEGGGPQDVVRINAYVTDRAYMAGYMAARDRWLAAVETPPASTLVIVSGFTREEFKVEVEVTAAINSDKRNWYYSRRWFQRLWGR